MRKKRYEDDNMSKSRNQTGKQMIIAILGTLHIMFGSIAIWNHYGLVAYLLIEAGVLLHIVSNYIR